jgi:hypothetical protein
MAKKAARKRSRKRRADKRPRFKTLRQKAPPELVAALKQINDRWEAYWAARPKVTDEDLRRAEKVWWGPRQSSQQASTSGHLKRKQKRVQPQSDKARRALLGRYITADSIPKPAEMSDKVLAGKVKEWLATETHRTQKSNKPFPSDDVVGRVRKELLKS